MTSSPEHAKKYMWKGRERKETKWTSFTLLTPKWKREF
jgi:hypothetical protein